MHITVSSVPTAAPNPARQATVTLFIIDQSLLPGLLQVLLCTRTTYCILYVGAGSRCRSRIGSLVVTFVVTFYQNMLVV